jgi:hypothetical protein
VGDVKTAVKECLKVLESVQAPGASAARFLDGVRRDLSYLAGFGECRYCGVKVPEYCNTCASCADENGP